MIMAVTGHRPDKIYGYWEDHPPYQRPPQQIWLRDRICDQLRKHRPLYGLSGMALGADWDFAECCVMLDIPFIAAVPFVGQEKRWSLPQQRRYHELLRRAYEVVVVSPGGYSRDAMIVRNHWLIEHSNTLLAIFNGSPGGTCNTVLVAAHYKRETIFINPDDFRVEIVLRK